MTDEQQPRVTFDDLVDEWVEIERLGAELVRLRHADSENKRLRAALQRLVDLKDGPRDSVYHREKPRAWEAARTALTHGDDE